MKNCRHCDQPIHWDTYWTTWEHSARTRDLLYVELCEPSKGFEGSTYAEPVR